MFRKIKHSPLRAQIRFLANSDTLSVLMEEARFKKMSDVGRSQNKSKTYAHCILSESKCPPTKHGSAQDFP